MVDDRPLLTINDLAAKLRVNRQQIYRLINSGELRPVRVGSVYRFTPEFVDEYLSHLADHSYARWERRQENGHD